MNTISMLMAEHRLIERIIARVVKEVKRLDYGQKTTPAFIDAIVDFIRFYANRTHHGKEEDILFRAMAKKGLSAEHQRLMQELVDEHNVARRNTRQMAEANDRLRHGDETVVNGMADNLRQLADLYPPHIAKEETIFFPASANYFSPEEQHQMLDEFLAFDRKMIHEKYQKVVAGLEAEV